MMKRNLFAILLVVIMCLILPTSALASWSTVDHRTPVSVSNPSSVVIGSELYVVGGFSRSFQTTGELFVIDLETSEWTQKATMPTPRYDSTAGVLDGEIYVAGGHEYYTGERYDVVEVYNPERDEWRTVASLPLALEDAESIVFDGKWYVIGGNGLRGASKRVFIYDKDNDEWTEGRALPKGMSAFGVTELDGYIHVIGGEDHFVFNPSKYAWEERTPMTTNRTHHAVVSFNDKIFAIGGTEKRGLLDPPTPAIEVYDSETDTWEVLEDMPYAKSRYAWGILDNNFYVVSGWSSKGFSTTLEKLDLSFESEGGTVETRFEVDFIALYKSFVKAFFN